MKQEISTKCKEIQKTFQKFLVDYAVTWLFY